MEITQSEGVVKQNLGIETAPHLKARLTTPKIMGIVLLSLLPALAMMIFFFGMGGMAIYNLRNYSDYL